ncbi:MAG: hypothetical protein GF355_16500 [Candidatus Eisenbacteria bacterium]|nr:hypothetical protein [Candidatus Eisenbacteria bacterium]
MFALIYLFAAALLGSASIFLGWPWFPPFLQATLIFPLYLFHILNRDTRRALVHMLVWALVTSAATILITVLDAQTAQQAIWRSTDYHNEMFHWIRTGVGPESTPSQFIPQHIWHYALFLGVSLITLGWGGLVMGAALLNYMNYYVGTLVLAATHPTNAVLVGWPPYAMIRVVAYVCGAVALSDFVVAVVLRKNVWDRRVTRTYLLWSAGLFGVDIVVKFFLAPVWRRVLERALSG